MFIDASAIIAIIQNEQESLLFIEKLKNSKKIYSSALVQYQVLAELCKINKPKNKALDLPTIKEIKFAINAFFDVFKISLIAIRDSESLTAFEAYETYGIEIGHEAKLNMGDCFSYACAKNYKLPLLFKGNNFVHTDIKKA